MWSTDICPEHLYIHWPFCENKCHFCECVAFEKHRRFQKAYHKALCQDIRAFSTCLPKNAPRKIQTIFLGGGAPSLYPPKLLEELFGVLGEHFILDEAKEVTIEVHPVGIDSRRLSFWRSLGINRLSIGVQVLDEVALLSLNRRQKNKEVKKLLELAPSYFKDISVDLILGLPKVVDSVWEETLAYVTSLPITHISVYSLSVQEKTLLFFKMRKGKMLLPAEEKVVDQFLALISYLRKKGFEQYELSNFAKPGFESLHNKAHWERTPYKGFGIGAASFDGSCRYQAIKNFSQYLAVYDCKDVNPDKVIGYKEIISSQQRRLEELMLGLRQKNGVDLHRMLYSLKAETKLEKQKKLQFFKEQLLIEERDGKIFLTSWGMVLENEVIIGLF